jgi:uncharacterized protein YndB with AHSA1/START domain
MNVNNDLANAVDREIVSIRIFPNSREILFKAWMDPDDLAHWWGPKDFTNTFEVFEPKPGGIWKFVMHGPDGVDYHNKSVFEEIVAPQKIVFQHLKPMHKFRVTVTFDDLGSKTQLTFRMLFDSPEECDKVKLFAIESNEQNFDRLEKYVNQKLN